MALNSRLIKNIIFDLDDTLFDTYGQLVVPATRESCTAMIKAGLKADLDECLIAKEKLSLAHPRGNIYSLLTKHFGVEENVSPEKVIEAGFKAFHDRDVKEPIHTFEDTIKTLEILRSRYHLFLVTLGVPKTQQIKIDRLNLGPFFERIFRVDISDSPTKRSAFEAVMKLTEDSSKSHLSVGNRIDSEIKDAKVLGMQTVLFMHGEYKHLKPENVFETPDDTIQHLSELIGLLK